MPSATDSPRLLGRWWIRSALYGFGCYAGLVLMLLFLENRLTFPLTTAAQYWQPPPVPTIQDVTLASSDGIHIHAWWLPVDNSDLAILYCHGNAGNLSQRGPAIVRMSKLLNASVLIIDYPGYGKSEGSPTEAGCYAAADAAHAWLVNEKKIAPRKILLFGASLGGGVTTDLATRTDCRALVLAKTFASLPDVASDLYWWLPAPKRWLMRNRFDNLAKIAQCKRPVFLAHGTADRLIPVTHSKRLYQAANEPKQFLELPGDHNDPLPEMMFTELKAFLDRHP
jgi:fermentation-respiration switch protein FrsA (DUF1100 family)